MAFTTSLGPYRKVQPFKLINDPIHGHIELDSRIMQFIDTPQFQRLRDLKQLGSCYFVFPGASHNRFEHCIGVSHLAGQLMRHLRTTQPELRITDHDVLMVRTAGLCHDLGHGPFSHVFDNEFIPRARPGSEWTHEQGSVMMLDYLIDDNHIDWVSPKDRLLLHELINPYNNPTRQVPEKMFLYDIVANARNSVDVDKFDYIARDCHNTGIKSSCDFERLLKNCKVVNNELCFHAKEVDTLYDLFHSRYSLFKRVYSHRTSKAIEYMITDVLLEADPVFKISDAIDNAENYMKLTDSILKAIEVSSDPALKKAQEIIYRLRKRRLYKMVGQTLLQKNLAKALPRVVESDITTLQPAGGTLRPEDIIVHDLKINYSMKDKNPVDGVKFFASWDAKESFHIAQDKVSHIIPETFQDRYVRVYIRDPSNEAKMASVIAAFDRFIKRHRCVSPNPAFSLSQGMISEEDEDCVGEDGEYVASQSQLEPSRNGAVADSVVPPAQNGAFSQLLDANADGDVPMENGNGAVNGNAVRSMSATLLPSTVSPCPAPRKRGREVPTVKKTIDFNEETPSKEARHEH